MVLIRRILMVCMLALPMPMMAQVEDAVEQWLEEGVGEYEVSEWMDLQQQFRDNPVNINDTNAVETLPFISPFQIQALKNYILLYGQLLSIKELRLVPGFDSLTVAMLSPMLKVEPFEPSQRVGWKELLTGGRHTIVTGVGGTVEQAEGYRNGKYEGDNLRAIVSYSYNYRHNLSFRFSADKDPMEAWGKDNFYNFHLMLKDIGRLEKLIVGRYNLQFGQGTTLWTGFRPFHLTGDVPVRYASGVRPSGVFYEESWQQGLAATVRLGRGFHLSGFGSLNGDEKLAGGHLGYRRGNLVLGVTAFGADRFYLGADALWQYGVLQLFGEVSAAGDALAAVGGARVSASDRNSFGVTLRHYDPDYRNPYANAYAISSTVNEIGMTLDARVQLPWSLQSLLSVDLYRYPSPRYASNAPSTGAWLRAQLVRSFGSHVEASARYAWRQKQRNIPNIDSTLYLSEQTLRQELQCRVRAEWGAWRFTTRATLSQFDAEHAVEQWGRMVSQEVRWEHSGWQLTAQGTWFDVDGYYARIYLTEACPQYAFSSPMLNGKGFRTMLMVRYEISNRLALSAKYTLAVYPGVESVGSGNAATQGDHRQGWVLRLRWKF